jgi:hypothetical protein
MNFASTTRNVLAGMLLAISAGCFSEPAESETGSPSCDPGSFGCECLGGVCEPDLECTPTNVCIPEDCTPGTAVCECDAQGQCNSGLECTGNVCFPSGGTSVGTDTEGSSMSATSTLSTTTDGTTTTSTTEPDNTGTTESVDSSTTEDPTGQETSSSTTDGPLSCGQQNISCSECFTCANTNDCIAEFDECGSIDGCLIAANCIEECANGVCFMDCCAGESLAFRDAAEALHSCRADTCIVAPCDGYAPIEPGWCGS